jgi:opacity protein-like surface antigen
MNLRAVSVKGILTLTALWGLCAAAHAQLPGPPAGKALVFLYRVDRQPVAGSVAAVVNADRVGALSNGTYVTAVVNPGRTFLRVGDRVLSTLALQTAPNQRYFVLVEAVPGATPLRVEMRQMTEAAARRSLAQSSRAGAAPAAAAVPRAPAAAAAPRAPAAAVPAPRAPQASVPSRPAAVPKARAPQPSAPPRQVAAPRRAAPAVPPEEEEEKAGWRTALILRTGTFKMATSDQTVAGLPSIYDTKSKPVFGLELELRHREGLALGAEFFYYKNNLTSNGATAGQAVLATMVNAKYYLHAADSFLPYVGAGVGFASAAYNGNLTGTSGGPALQGLAGAEFRFSDVGLRLEYKYLASTVGKNEKIKVGGGGVLVGLSITF